MNRFHARIAALAVSVALCLACGGVESGPPEPPPRPDPAENADECKMWKEVRLPLRNGIIVKCSEREVQLEHGEDARPIRWKYLEKYKKKNWMYGEPEDGNPILFKGPNKLTFLSDGEVVIIKSSR